MKLITFRQADEIRIGAIATESERVLDLSGPLSEAGLGHAASCMRTFLETGDAGLQVARQALAGLQDADSGNDGIYSPVDIDLRAPVSHPNKIFCLAGNYQDHIEEGGRKMDAQDKETPRVFMKPPSTTVTAPGEPILIPPVARSVDWEGELAVVMGRAAKGVSADEALEYVAGYTIMNDVSERKLLIKSRSESRPQDQWFDWLNGKWLDTFAPQGPWLVTADEVSDAQDLNISTYVNGERRQHNNTGQMLYPVNMIIEYISAIITLEPGDLISTGTISGVGATTGEFLKPGDQVEISITGLGSLKNPVAESQA